MDKNFWLERWTKNEIAFHQKEASPFLVRYFDKLSLSKGDRVFVPLCGKTLDISWLLFKGYRVVGAELIESAIVQLFAELDVKPKISQAGKLKLYSAENIDIFVGDIFDLSSDQIGRVDGIYDRAALVALPSEMRIQYAKHLLNISGRAPQLLVTFDYDQKVLAGPPFSISGDEVKRHYSDNYQLTLIETVSIPGGLKGQCPANENVWILNGAS